MNIDAILAHALRQTWVRALVLAVIFSILLHLSYSWIGFNPTDDGFVLSSSRRLLDGQIPHLDYISLRPALSHYLHAPIVAVGGSYTIWLSRLFVWFQLVAISWFWVGIAARVTLIKLQKSFIGLMGISLWVAIATFFSAHTFPIMAWNTIDGLFAISAGLWILARKNNLSWLGFFLLGCAPLFKQNFIFVLPVVFFLFQGWKRENIFFHALMGVPVVLMMTSLFFLGALPDALQQFIVQGSIVFSDQWLVQSSLLPTFLGLIAQRLITSRKILVKAASILVWASFLFVISQTFDAAINYIYQTSFSLVHFSFGFALSALFNPKTRKSALWLLLAVTICISTSISLGYMSPALGVAGVLVFIFAVYYSNIYRNVLLTFLFWSCTAGLSFVSVQLFHYMRYEGVYRDNRAYFLKYELGDVLPGGKLIYSNDQTYRSLAEIKAVQLWYPDQALVIMPDYPMYWTKSEQPNLISIDWPQPVELSSQALVDRVIGDIDALPHNSYILVQKYQASRYADGLFPLPVEEYKVAAYVDENFELTDETTYFLIYQTP